jgi:hypothetical protein
VREQPVRDAVDLRAGSPVATIWRALVRSLSNAEEALDLVVEALEGLVAEEAQHLEVDLVGRLQLDVLGAHLDRGGRAQGAPQVAQRVAIFPALSAWR